MTHHAGQVQLPGQVSGAAFLGSLFTKKGALKKLRARVIAKAKGKSKAKPGTHRPKNQPSVSFFLIFILVGAVESTFLSFFTFWWFEARFGPSVYREMIGKWEQ